MNEIAQVQAPATVPSLMTPADVQEFMRLPSEDAARRYIRKLPVGIRVVNVGKRVLVNRARLLAHLGVRE